MSRVTTVFICLASILAASPNSAAQNKTPNPSPVASAPKKAEAFKPFTGKVCANKVRLRVKADLESHVLKQINKNELLMVIGEEGDFYAVEPPKGTKAYVFRSYILDDKIEANRVNVRLEPNVEAAVIGQLQAGDVVKGQICSTNRKWLEIPAPKTTRFYVSKEFIAHAGGPEFLAAMEKRRVQVEDLMNTAFLMAEAECKKTYQEMNPSPAIDQFQSIIKNFTDFPESVVQAKEALALLKETYLNKKIAYLESKAELPAAAKEELLAKHRAESSELFSQQPISPDPELWSKRAPKKAPTNSMQAWDALEESLYLSWTAFHSGKKTEDFYAEQKANAHVLTGVVRNYLDNIKDRPGNYLLSHADGAFSYLYSTQVDLAEYVGKTVSILVSPRPNNHFAFPAYFVLEVE